MSFTDLARFLLTRCELVVNDKVCLLAEIEMYGWTQEHPDSYADKHPLQATTGNFHFARAGKSPTSAYKSGTYKRVDFCFGREGFYLGVLLRSLQTPDEGLIEGPCRCVNYILKSYNVDKIDDLVLPTEVLPFTSNKHNFVLREAQPRTVELLCGPRIGLNSEKCPPFHQVPYRFVVSMKGTSVKKERSKLSPLPM